MNIITLTTDFGLSDEYAGAMKGSILSVNPSATIVDITHAVDALDIRQAAHLLKAACPFFPKGTVHVAVVDPGVGTDRPMCALRAGGHLFVGPDNGVLTLAAPPEKVEIAVRLENSSSFRPAVSATFHGRDVFGPVAAHIAAGMPLRKLGAKVAPEALVRLEMSRGLSADGLSATGCVIAADRFGNLITDIDREGLTALCPPEKWADLTIRAGRIEINGIVRTYGVVAAGTPVALIGSRATLEVAVSCGSAADRLHLRKGDTVTVVKKS